MSFSKDILPLIKGAKSMIRISSNAIRNSRAVLAFILVPCIAFSGCRREYVSPKGYLVRNVIDGDTVELSNGRRVRYIGVDTPETMKKVAGRWLHNPEPFALEAKKLNRSLVGGRRVSLEFDSKKEDKYGRWLAYVKADGKMVNTELLRDGYALLVVYPPNDKHLKVLVEAQKEAKDARRGLWKDLKTISASEANAYVGRVVTIKGTVESVVSSGNTVFLNFIERGVSVIIYGSNLQFFANPERSYKDKILEITGKIKDRNGPSLVVYHPTQVRIVGE